MQYPEYSTLEVSCEGAVARLRLNRPDALNSVSSSMRMELVDAVAKINVDPDVRVVILSGNGRAFCAGADLTEAGAADPAARGLETELQLKGEYKPSIMGIVESPKLWIAQVTGAAAGIGSAYMLACDLVVMAESSYLYQAFIAIALIPDGGATWQLMHTLGRKRAMQIILEGERISANACLVYGLCNKVVADGSEADAAMEWAQSMAKKAPIAVRQTKKALHMASDVSFGEMISQEAALQNICISSEDAIEGVQAFLEKREANFKGR
ncbi:MAG: enoyl-CoA hydratase-related protein [Pseudomonadota bacterium]